MKSALIVIDMQNDYLWEKRKPQFRYDTALLVGNVNELIRQQHAAGQDVIYIRHIIQNLPTNRLLFGYSLAGTEGAELYGGLEIVSDHCFDKLVGDALSNGRLRDLIREKGYEKLRLCGLDECGCVTSTALGAARRGIPVEIVRDGTATVFPGARVKRAHARLEKAGVKFV